MKVKHLVLILMGVLFGIVIPLVFFQMAYVAPRSFMRAPAWLVYVIPYVFYAIFVAGVLALLALLFPRETFLKGKREAVYVLAGGALGIALLWLFLFLKG